MVLRIITLLVALSVIACGDMNVSDPQLEASNEEAPAEDASDTITQGDYGVAVQNDVNVDVTVNTNVYKYDSDDPQWILKPAATWAGHMGSAGAYRLATRTELLELFDNGELVDQPSWLHFWTATEDPDQDALAIAVRVDDGYSYAGMKITKLQAIFVRAQ